ncbi:hypothetical protein AN189_07195 [Loktanella sp. 3ANDIMAR09]|uniref:hypothetical protein n=1 Tax=Loktanella sp. 3ANDIMAR09 TaxID=1225657 RepID=UPI0007003341|nr:hypothetical protein [Loktanella sp. 3ANDIMAR09]KQI68686.1 hypothetical protein AN189_07195 [Loktanella sp. 3ANDIMAR09]
MSPDEKQKLDDLHDFFLKPRAPGKPSRAAQIDDLLEAVRAGKLTARAVLWLAGAAISIAAVLRLLGGMK